MGVLLAPIFESIIEIILTTLEAIKGKLSITVAKYNEQLAKMCNTNDNTQTIGFALPNEEVDYD